MSVPGTRAVLGSQYSIILYFLKVGLFVPQTPFALSMPSCVVYLSCLLMTYWTLNLAWPDLETFSEGRVAWLGALGPGCPSCYCLLSLSMEPSTGPSLTSPTVV